MTMTFKGTHAFITGGTSELAIALSRLLIENGIRPCLACRNEKGQEKTASALSPFFGLFDSCILDFSDYTTLETAFDHVKPNLHYLVDIAHGDYENLMAAANPAASSGYFSENVSFRAAMIKTASRIMMKSGHGRFVFVSSAAAGRPGKGQGFYAASKLASEALYRNTALEMGRFGITAVSLRPGYIDCGRGRPFIEKKNNELIRQIPSGQFLTSSAVAETLLFLLSDGARGFNATELVMDGGYSSGKTD